MYIGEIENVPAIVALETAIPAFIGYTQKARNLEVGDLVFTPTRITSMAEFEHYFGGLVSESITINIDDIIKKTGNHSILDARKITTQIGFLKNNMHYQLQLFFANGGGPCYIVSSGKPKSLLNKKDLQKSLDEVYQYAEPTLLLFPDGVNFAKPNDIYELYNEALMQAFELKDRFVIMDINENIPGDKTAIGFFRENITGGENTGSLKYGAAYYPKLITAIPYHYTDNYVTIVHNTITKEPGKTDLKAKGEFDKLKLNNSRLSGTTIYSKIKDEIDNQTVLLPPSAAAAAVYASTDKNRGVWKAPASVSLSLIKTPQLTLTDLELNSLNSDPVTGKSINTIRYFTGKGTVVWGARTLAGNDNEWRYISVRRFFIMIEESITKATTPFVFEPNDARTWTKVKSMVDNFLTMQWRAGALMGTKPQEAFYVHVGVGQSMTAQDISDGKMIIEIGMAVVRPAEFIILRITHKMQQG
ncbi:MAG: phage tail sheath family protein [Chitinophagaceae bacterium]